jgi:hypothetical protein
MSGQACCRQCWFTVRSFDRIAASPNKSNAIDLTLSSSDLSLRRHSWMVLGNAAGSDHYPILSSLQTLEIPIKFFLPVFDLTIHISWSAFADTVLESLLRLTDEMSLWGVYAIFMEVVSGVAISAQTRTPEGYLGPGAQKAEWWDTECDRASEQKLMAFREFRDYGGSESYIKLTLIVKRTYGIYANVIRRKRGKDTAPLSHMKPDYWTSGKWLENCGTFDRKSQLLITILMLGYQRLHPKLLRILLQMSFRSHIWPHEGSYG